MTPSSPLSNFRCDDVVKLNHLVHSIDKVDMPSNVILTFMDVMEPLFCPVISFELNDCVIRRNVCVPLGRYGVLY
jgi:hypothetical protein